MKKVVFCIPTVQKPFKECLDSLRESVPLFEDAGYEHYMVSEVGNPYISSARSFMLKKALDAGADIIVFIDHDVSWDDKDLLKLVQTEGEVCVGTYRFKKDEVEYMGQVLTDANHYPIVRESDGAISAFCAPAGFLKVTRRAINIFIENYPNLCYGDRTSPHIDLFNHGAYNHVWYGEDYAFCRNWLATKNPIWLVPDLNINHHTKDKVYEGNYHKFLLKQPEGSDSDNPVPPDERKPK
jgi:glycosyltransferase involved in cell wall biosynthesis